jgi:pimeloyl-ACP methyl ester carboxylesterase
MKSVTWVGLSVAGLMAALAYSLRWQHVDIDSVLHRDRDRAVHKLPVKEKKANSFIRKTPVVLLHGMWHSKREFNDLQYFLADNGYSSYAVDLQAGERFLPLGYTQREIVADLEAAIAGLGLDEFVLLGHSQGGVVAQSLLIHMSPALRAKVIAVVLLGTFPLGLPPPPALLQQTRSMYTFPGYAYLALFGRLWSAGYARDIFLAADTDVSEPSIEAYLRRLLAAPGDGLITMTHFISPEPVTQDPLPCLVMGGGEDIIYPPHMLKEAFDARFAQATHIVAPGQAHCFRDAGWEAAMATPLVEWLDVHA